MSSAAKTEQSMLKTACCTPLGAGDLTEEDAERTADMLKALADPIRLRLVSMIGNTPQGEACACDFAEPVGRSQPTVSHHLSILVKAGILSREQRGKWAWFRVNDDVLTDIASAISS